MEKAKFSQSFVLKSQAFLYPSKFYLPPETIYQFEEGVARFELIQTVHQLVISPFLNNEKPLMLNEDFFNLLRMHLTKYIGSVLPKNDEDTLAIYGQLILEEAQKQGVVF